MFNTVVCPSSASQVPLDWWYQALLLVVVSSSLMGLSELVQRRRRLWPSSTAFLGPFNTLTPVVTIVSSANYLWDSFSGKTSMVSCEIGPTLYLDVFCNTYFLLRVLARFGVSQRLEILSSVVDLALLFFSLKSIDEGYVVHAFKFLTLVRFVYPEFRHWQIPRGLKKLA